jgi:hypothetical protein
MITCLGNSQSGIGDIWVTNSIPVSVIGGIALTGGRYRRWVSDPQEGFDKAKRITSRPGGAGEQRIFFTSLA